MDQYSKTSSTATDSEETGEPWDIFVKSGSKLRNIIARSLTLLQSKKEEKITITASGPTVTKAITCAEIVKRKIKGLHQSNKLFYTKIEDTWESNESTLDKLQVTRKIPSIKITLSRVPLDPSQPGYQSPGNSKSPVQFRSEDWELAYEDKADIKGSERSRPGQGENRAKRSKGHKDGFSRAHDRRHLQNDNVKGDSDSDNDKFKVQGFQKKKSIQR